MSENTTQLVRQNGSPQGASYESGANDGVAISAPSYTSTADDSSSPSDSGQGGEGGDSIVFVNPPAVAVNYDDEFGECIDPEVDSGERRYMTSAQPDGGSGSQTDHAADIQQTAGDFNLSQLSVAALEALFTSVIGPQGSNNQLSLGLMFGIGVSTPGASLFGGIKIQFAGEAEHNTEGKLKLQAGFSLGGYVRGEIARIFRVSAEAVGTVQIEGEYGSMNDFAGDLYNNIIEANRSIRTRIARYVGESRVPDSINMLADLDTQDGVVGPRVTTSTRTTLSGSVEVGNDEGGASWSGGRTAVDYTATGGGEARETGRQVIYEGSHGIHIGQYDATIGFKHTETNSSNDSNDKEELELTGALSGVQGSISESSCREVSGTITSGVEASGNMASFATNTCSSVLEGIQDRIQGGAAGATAGLTNRGTIQIVLKFEKAGNERQFTFKEFGVFMVQSLEFEGRAQAPIGTTGLMGEVGTEFSGAITRPIFFYRPS